ncbi:MAG: tetratricopeptide repeat protein, partial [Proteobacteria bacterium]
MVEPHISATLNDLQHNMKTKKYEKALPIAQDMAVLRGESNDLYNLGLCFFHLNKLRDALASLTRAISLDSNKANFWSSRGTVLLNLGGAKNLDDALSDFQQAVKLDGSSHNLTGLGMALVKAQQYEEALLVLNRALKYRSTNEVALFFKGEAQDKLGHYAAALKIWRKLEKYGIGVTEVWAKMASTLIAMGHYQEALHYKIKSAEAFPDNASIQSSVAATALLAREFALSLKFADEALESGYESVHLHLSRAQALIGLGNFAQGLAELENTLPSLEESSGHEHFEGYVFGLLLTFYLVFERDTQ